MRARRQPCLRGCLPLWAAACAAARASAEETLVEVSLIQLSAHAASEAASEARESAAVYEAVAAALSRNGTLSHSQHIWEFVAAQPYAPSLSGRGCLYLPSNEAWRSFYDWVERPYPPLFADLIANAWDPHCGAGQAAGCPAGHVEGSHWPSPEPLEVQSQLRMPQSLGPGIGCVRTRHASTTNDIHIFEAEGHVGLPGKWRRYVDAVKEDFGRLPRKQRLQHGRMALDSCSNPAGLPAVPADKRLSVPVRFIICCSDRTSCPISEAMAKEQVRWMTNGYAGKEGWTEMPFDLHPPPQVDTQIGFHLEEIKYVEDASCARDGFYSPTLAYRHNTDGEGMLNYVILTDDQCGYLGYAEFPDKWNESSPELAVMINAKALRGYASMVMARAATLTPPEATSSTRVSHEVDLAFDEGDTCIHEGGHSLGLYHTFEGGCTDGDGVTDTAAEEFPSYLCEDKHSCESTDPVRNFMDYSPDACMAGFTEMQKRRLWCMVRHYRPTLYNISLTDRQSDSARGSPTDALKG